MAEVSRDISLEVSWMTLLPVATLKADRKKKTKREMGKREMKDLIFLFGVAYFVLIRMAIYSVFKWGVIEISQGECSCPDIRLPKDLLE